MARKFTVGALIGIVAGVIGGILTAPKSGRDTRDELKHKAVDLEHKAEGYVERSERAAKGALDGAKRGFFGDKKTKK